MPSRRRGRELDAIVTFVEQLSSDDVSGVEPVAQVTGLVNVGRDDIPGPRLSQEDVLRGAPSSNDRAFLVPKAVER